MGLVAVCSSSAYLTRYCISVANSNIQEEFNLRTEDMGYVLGIFSFGYLLYQVPGGVLGNRIGTRTALPLLSTMWSLVTVWTAAIGSLLPLLASRFLFGLYQAGLVPNSAMLLKTWLPVRNHGVGSALIGASMSIGGAITMWLTGILMEHYDWREIFLAYSLVGIVWAVAFYILARSRPEEHPAANEAEVSLINGNIDQDRLKEAVADDETSMAAVLVQMLSNRSMWAICVQSYFRAAGYIIIVTWFPAFLEKAFHVTKAEAGGLTSALLIAVVAGSLSGGFVVDTLFRRTDSKWISRSLVASVALGLCGAFTLAATLTGSVNQLVAAMAIGALFSGIGSPAAWAATMDVSGHYTTVGVGVMNMAGTLSGITVPIGLGYLIAHIERTNGNWNLVVYLSASFYIAGSLSWLFVDPNQSLGSR